MNILLGIVIGILSLMVLVTAHEFGHFLMARKNGVEVDEFGICFPPRAMAWVKGKDGKWKRLPKKDWSKKQKSLVISLNWLPIGGFCAMRGESDADTKPGTFGAANLWAKTKILLGGVMMNWLIAAVIFTILAWVGMPQFMEGQCRIEVDAHDEVVQLNDEVEQPVVRHTWAAPIVGVGTTVQVTGETFRGLGILVKNLFTGVFSQILPDEEMREAGREELAEVGDSVSGPIGIVGTLFPNMVKYGPVNILFLVAIISVSLACMNVLPIPALDGGRLLLIVLFRLRGRKLEKATEEKIVSRAMYVLLVLILIVTILDVVRLF